MHRKLRPLSTVFVIVICLIFLSRQFWKSLETRNAAPDLPCNKTAVTLILTELPSSLNQVFLDRFPQLEVIVIVTKQNEKKVARLLEHQNGISRFVRTICTGHQIEVAKAIKQVAGKYCVFQSDLNYITQFCKLLCYTTINLSTDVLLFQFRSSSASVQTITGNEEISHALLTFNQNTITQIPLFQTKFLEKHIAAAIGCRESVNYELFFTAIASDYAHSLQIIPIRSFRRYKSLEMMTNKTRIYLDCIKRDKQTLTSLKAIIKNTTYERTTSYLLQYHVSFFFKTDRNTSGRIYDILRRTYTIPGIVTELRKQASRNEIVIVKRMKESSSFQRTFRVIQTIGIYFHRYYQGGIERVISLQIPMFIELGFKVVLFTDEIVPEKEYPLDPKVHRVQLPGSYDTSRAEVFYSELQLNKIDLLLHHDNPSENLLYDILIAKALDIRVIIGRHASIVHHLLINDFRLSVYPYIYSLADKVVVLSKMDQSQLNLMGIPAVYLPNPLKLPKVIPDDTEREQLIIWVGRLSYDEKNYFAPLKIMERVVESHQEAKMVLIGPAFTKDSDRQVLQFIREHELANNIEWIGNTNDLQFWYRKAKIHLLTSSFEAFPMVVIESKSFAVPLVLYSIPYLELLKDGKGYISVPQYDVEGAANAICDILDNNTLYQQLSKQARESVIPFATFDLKRAWLQMIKHLEQGGRNSDDVDSPDTDELKLLLTTFFSQYTPYHQYLRGNDHFS